MFALSKLLGYLLMPLGLLWLGLGVTAWRAWGRSRSLSLGLAALGLLLTLAGNVQLGHAVAAALEGRVPRLEIGEPLEAVFVLGGGTSLDTRGEARVGPAGDRLVEAARLWHAGKTRRLVASGAASDRDLAAESRRIWRDLGIPEEAILAVPETCLNTSQEVAAYRRLAVRQGWRRVGLLTSSSHLPRAMALARREGLDAMPLHADSQGRAVPFQLWHLVPQEEGLRLTQMVAWELLGKVVGR